MLGELLFKLHLNSYHVEHSPYMLFRAHHPCHSKRAFPVIPSAPVLSNIEGAEESIRKVIARPAF